MEAEFKNYFIERSMARARWATAIYLALVAVMTAINMRGSMAPLSEAILQPIYLLRLGVACPALVLIPAATVVPTQVVRMDSEVLQEFYEEIEEYVRLRHQVVDLVPPLRNELAQLLMFGVR